MIAYAARFHLAAIAAGESDRYQPHFPGLGEGSNEVRRIAAGGDADQSISGLALGDDLPNEDMLKTDIVADGGNHRKISNEIDGGQRRPASRDRVHEFNSDMRRITARAAVAHGKHPAAVPVDIGKRLRGGDQDGGLLGEKLLVRRA